MSLEKAKYQAIKFLAYRPRTVQEVRNYLQKKLYNPEVIIEVIDYLKEQSYLDDNKFCELWIENRSRFKPRGKNGLFFELKGKGIDSSLIEEAISQNYPPEKELEIAKDLVDQKLMMLYSNSPNANEKIMAYLYRRGFTISIIQKIISEIKQ